MWKRDEAVKPANGQPAVPAAEPQRHVGRDVVNIGKSIVIKGELNGSEDLTVEGQVEGTIDLRDNVLTIGAHGNIKAQVLAKAVIVLGSITGNITASEKVEIRDGGSVEGDLVSPRVAIAEGARFRGSIDMQTKRAQAAPRVSPSTHHQPSHAVGLTGQQQDQPVAAAAY